MSHSSHPIVAVQIQTIDACNASCIMCPHKSVAHGGQPIDAGLFGRIVDQLAAQVTEGRVVEEVEVHLYFQNEPLLDGELFERARLVRQKLPRAHLVCFTNGLLLARRKQALLESDFDLLHLSLYGDDARSFNRITGLRLDDEQVGEIIGTIAEIERSGQLSVVTTPAWREIRGRKELFDFSSRAGFYTGKVLHRVVRGCAEGRHRWLCFRASGELVLCCMDWERETLFGNVAEHSLGELLDSDPYRQLVGRVGGADSEQDFICKRCEWAVPASDARTVGRNKRTLVYTAAGPGDEPLLGEWLASLRTLGDYHGEALVLDQGLSEQARSLAGRLGARIEPCPADRGHWTWAGLPILERCFSKRAMACFDVASWFQGPVSPLFDELDHVPGCLYSVRHSAQSPEGPDAAKLGQVIRRCKGAIHGGFVAGRYRPFIEKLSRLARAYHEAEGQAADAERLINVLFDFGRDRADGYRWSCAVDQAELKPDGWYHPLHSDMWLRGDSWVVGTRRDEKLVGVHLPSRQQTARFSSLHPGRWRQILAEVS